MNDELDPKHKEFFEQLRFLLKKYDASILLSRDETPITVGPCDYYPVSSVLNGEDVIEVLSFYKREKI